MTRREFITLLGGAAVAWPVGARAQQPTMPVVGFLRSATLDDDSHIVAAFRQGLKEMGFIEGGNVAIEYRAADNDRVKLAALAADFSRRPVALIVGNVLAAIAAQAATSTVPIVFATGSDPVRDGLVTSLNRPGGNVTGVSFLAAQLVAKRLELLRHLVPGASTMGVLVAPASDGTTEIRDVQAAASAIGQQLVIVEVGGGIVGVRGSNDIEGAFATFAERGAAALITLGGAYMSAIRKQVIALASRQALPASYPLREYVVDGGLLSYAPSITDAYRQVGVYAGRILKGEKPGDLPVVQATRFEFVINLKTAKALGLQIPDKLLAIADEVIE
jgi:putative ABC transport system substrate-binding protein